MHAQHRRSSDDRWTERQSTSKAHHDWHKIGAWTAALLISALIWLALALTVYALWEWVTK